MKFAQNVNIFDDRCSNLPPGASFNSSTRTFTLTHGHTQAGTYNGIHFEVSDGHWGVDSEDITIVVTDVLRSDTITAAAGVVWFQQAYLIGLVNLLNNHINT